MAKGRRPTKKVVEVESTLEQNIIVEEQQNIIVVEETVVEENVLQEEVKEVVFEEQKKELFTMDISEYGVAFDDAEKFVKTAIKFYFENKDKPKQQEVITKTDEKSTVMLDKINSFEKSLTRFQFIPRKMIIDFIKDLRK